MVECSAEGKEGRKTICTIDVYSRHSLPKCLLWADTGSLESTFPFTSRVKVLVFTKERYLHKTSNVKKERLFSSYSFSGYVDISNSERKFFKDLRITL